MAFPKKLGQLCTPALVYFVISMIAIVLVIMQNLSDNSKLHLGNFSCRVPSTFMVLAIKVVYILFWTWVLNLICKDGHSGIAWLLVLLPFILVFVIVGLVMINQKKEQKKQHPQQGQAQQPMPMM